LRLAVLLREVQGKDDSIKTGVINYDMVTFEGTTLGGEAASVFKPKPDQIRILRDEIFGGGAVSALAAGADPVQSAKQEAARIRLTNGSAAPDFGQRTATYLQGLGLTVTELAGGNATDRTIIVLYSPKLYTARFILFLFGLNGNSGTSQIRFEPNSASPVDVEIILGNDALNANRVP
jgi:hypothetical protein